MIFSLRIFLIIFLIQKDIIEQLISRCVYRIQMNLVNAALELILSRVTFNFLQSLKALVFLSMMVATTQTRTDVCLLVFIVVPVIIQGICWIIFEAFFRDHLRLFATGTMISYLNFRLMMSIFKLLILCPAAQLWMLISTIHHSGIFF